MTKLPKDFNRIKMEEEMLRQDAKRRTAERNELDFWSKVMIVAGAAMLVTVLFYAGEMVDALSAVIGL